MAHSFQERKRRLDDSYYLHRFLSDFRDLVSWIQDMKSIIAADELAKDVAGAEALLERHQEHRGEIDAREDSFRATAEAGQLLVEKEHWAAPEVGERLVTLSAEKQNLLILWEERRILYEQCMDLQLFYRYFLFFFCLTLLVEFSLSIIACLAFALVTLVTPNRQTRGWPSRNLSSPTKIWGTRWIRLKRSSRNTKISKNRWLPKKRRSRHWTNLLPNLLKVLHPFGFCLRFLMSPFCVVFNN